MDKVKKVLSEIEIQDGEKDSTCQRQMEANLCGDNGPQWLLKTEEEKEEEDIYSGGENKLVLFYRGLSRIYFSSLIDLFLKSFRTSNLIVIVILKEYLPRNIANRSATINNVIAIYFWVDLRFGKLLPSIFSYSQK